MMLQILKYFPGLAYKYRGAQQLFTFSVNCVLCQNSVEIALAIALVTEYRYSFGLLHLQFELFIRAPLF